MKSLFTSLLVIVTVLSLTASVLLYFRWSPSRPLVTVGSQVITRKQFQNQLEYKAGQEVLIKMVFNDLVGQAAAREGVTPSPQDIDDRLQSIARRAPQLLAPYNQDPIKMAEFRQDLATEIALENLRIKDVAVTPSEVNTFYQLEKKKGAKGLFTLPEQVKTTTVVTESAVDASTAEELLRQNQPPDVIGRQPRLRVVGVNGYTPDLQTLSPALKKQISDYVQHAKVGETKTFREGPYFLTFQVAASSRAEVPPLNQIRADVERAVRLEHAPGTQQELSRLYQASPPKFNYDPDKYRSYFAAHEAEMGAKPDGK